MACTEYYIFTDGKWATIIDTPLTINGYEMKQEGDRISFGCAKFYKPDLKRLLIACGFVSNCSVTGDVYNRQIKSITLDSNVTITVKELQEIVDKIE